MAQPPTTDLVNDIDFTVLGNISGSILNQSFSLLTGNINTPDTEGVSLCLYTTDSAPGVPNVPNPFVGINTSKWKNYIWFRRPDVGDITSAPKVYGWNDGAVSDVTFLRWIDTGFDNTDNQAAIDSINASLAQIQILATQADSNATNALDNSNAAQVNAQAALDQIAAALLAATNASAAATAALARANAAFDLATAANAAAQAALTLAGLANNINNLLPGLNGQHIRTNYDVVTPKLEYYNEKDCIAILNSTNYLAPLVAGSNIIPVDVNVADTGTLVSALAASVITLVKGVYEFEAYATIEKVTANALWTASINLFDEVAGIAIAAQIKYVVNSSVISTTGSGSVQSMLQVIPMSCKGYLTTDGTKTYTLRMNSSTANCKGGLAQLWLKRIG